jgi:fructuronate reductase
MRPTRPSLSSPGRLPEDEGVPKENLPRLNRRLPGMPEAPPVRLVHIGVGNFHRAHQAWYTAKAPDAGDWGIAGFTVRRPDMADQLGPQDGLYTLITRGAAGDDFNLIGSLAAVHPGTDHAAYLDYLRRSEVAVVTITVTEVGYLAGPDGHHLDRANDTVQSDISALRGDPEAPVSSVPGKLVAGLLARRSAGGGPITILPCDNLPESGLLTSTVVSDFSTDLDQSLLAWIEQNVDFATSMVDRITPATSPEDRQLVARTQGYQDASPVPTEPFSEWVISGRFPAGRPAWQESGARIVDDVTPYEQRKLWLLNGSHSLLAYGGSIRGHATIDEAIADQECRSWVEEFWSEAGRNLILGSEAAAAYTSALLERFGNPRVRHQLSQIAPDGSRKLPIRILPTLRAERAAGRMPIGCATVIAAWILHLRGHGAPVKDPAAEAALGAAAAPDLASAVRGVLDTWDRELTADADLVETIKSRMYVLTDSP